MLEIVKLIFLPRTYEGGGGGGGGGGVDDKTSSPDVFSSCSFTPRANFERSAVMVSFYV